MKQYEMYFTNEYTEEIIDELAEIFKVNYDKSLLHQAIKEIDKSSINNIFVINIDESCIIVDCNNRDWIYSLIVISTDFFANSVSEIMMKWDNEIRKEYGQELVLCEQDVFGKSNTLLESIEEYYKQRNIGVRHYKDKFIKISQKIYFVYLFFRVSGTNVQKYYLWPIDLVNKYGTLIKKQVVLDAILVLNYQAGSDLQISEIHDVQYKKKLYDSFVCDFSDKSEMNEIGKIIIECNEWIMPNEEQDICDKLLTKRWIEVQGEFESLDIERLASYINS